MVLVNKSENVYTVYGDNLATYNTCGEMLPSRGIEFHSGIKLADKLLTLPMKYQMRSPNGFHVGYCVLFCSPRGCSLMGSPPALDLILDIYIRGFTPVVSCQKFERGACHFARYAVPSGVKH